MKVDVSFKYLTDSKLLDDVLDKNIKKLERRIQIYRKDAPIHVSVHLEKNPNKEQYFCKVNVYLPARLVVVDEKGTKPEVTLNKTFQAVSRQLRKVKYKVEKHLLGKGRESIKSCLDEDPLD
ncbi:MAG: HPF/RaiA family ribosome-associated protein [Candidatus Omnitrophica bacterium]|nr:HPF/RaiA family ribosome-associated protein [Candidatus Omnitrophota bacterium]MDD5081352.1 HPF/RaiA family ribosome-associated protein [Candidatus Omnitrophota bacterium]MDD5441433.1 HPF/RaiA family ribosome-associated protein [Candidatus Omnitrophota bacterium]